MRDSIENPVQIRNGPAAVNGSLQAYPLEKSEKGLQMMNVSQKNYPDWNAVPPAMDRVGNWRFQLYTKKLIPLSGMGFFSAVGDDRLIRWILRKMQYLFCERKEMRKWKNGLLLSSLYFYFYGCHQVYRLLKYHQILWFLIGQQTRYGLIMEISASGELFTTSAVI